MKSEECRIMEEIRRDADFFFIICFKFKLFYSVAHSFTQDKYAVK